MRIASAFFVLVLLGSLLDASAQVNPNRPRPRPEPIPSPMPTPLPDYHEPFPHGNQSQIISERVSQTLRFREQALISQLMRLSRSDEMLQVSSVTILGSSLRGQTTVDILSQGRPVSTRPEIIGRQLSEIRVILPSRTLVSDLEIQASDELFIDTITLELEHRGGGPGHLRQASSGELIRLELRAMPSRHNVIDLDQLIQIQEGITLEGASIDRIVVQATSQMHRLATVQLELNGRLFGQPRPLNPRVGGVPLPVKSPEEVRSLRLIVNGEAILGQVSIVIGQVRPIHHGPNIIRVHQEISSGRPLSLGWIASRENRMVSSITIEGSSRFGNGEINAVGSRGELLGRTLVSQFSSRATIHLNRPMMVSEISLETFSSIMIETIELNLSRIGW